MKIRDNKINTFAALVANGNIDPTRTKNFRDAWAGDMSRRFRNLKGDIRNVIIVADALGLSKGSAQRTGSLGVDIHAWADMRSDQKIEAFSHWLKRRLKFNDRPMEMVQKPGGEERSWMYERVKQAYIQGVRRAVEELRKRDVPVIGNIGGQGGLSVYAEGDSRPNITLPPEAVEDDAIRTFIQAETLNSLAQRTLSELQGVTSAMSQQIIREISDGIIQGLHPREIAANINKKVDNIGIKRARLIARTETIRAYHEGALDSYEAAGMGEVTYKAEWSATPDTRTCPFCRSMDGKIFSIKEMRGKIPAHPQCRCAPIPVLPGGVRTGVERPREIIGPSGERTGEFLGQ